VCSETRPAASWPGRVFIAGQGQRDDMVVLCDSKQPQTQILDYTASEWRPFVSDVKIGDFDVTISGACCTT
jgi:hypothetical protein